MDGIYPQPYYVFEDQRWEEVQGVVTEEILLCIHVNGKELVTFMCTPHDQDELALGFLRSEGIIRSPEEVLLLSISASGACVDVWLNHPGLFEHEDDPAIPLARLRFALGGAASARYRAVDTAGPAARRGRHPVAPGVLLQEPDGL